MKGMAEVIIDSGKQSKRRLPTWMLTNNSLKNEKSGNLDEFCSSSGNQTQIHDAASVVESTSNEAENMKDSEKEEIFQKNESKKNIRKLKKCDGYKDSTFINGGIKRKFEVEIAEQRKCVDVRHTKLRSGRGKSLKKFSQEMVDEVELTVEDLINIAEEFCTSDKELQIEQSEPSKSDSISSDSSEPFITHSRNLDLNGDLSKCTQSGDPAQDMLELFLGPLLKNASCKGADIEMKSGSFISSLESERMVRGFVDDEKHGTLMKKKTSLKDKVAMFI